MTMQASTPVSSTAAAQAAPRLQATLLAAAMMKTIHHDRYGPLDLLSLRDIEQPIVGDTDVLIRVRAAGLHIGDCFGVHGSPFPMRLVSGLRKPIYGVPGFDVAGLVEAVGSKVTQFRPGDAVFGA